ncbi:hypothetical protein A3B42_04050 [Candidatus Daviesbacteria bacterium RIFCSPLOWO2_01_FULL_38_10]|nr:MAG: hypothetical protein A3D02_04355 [Candidatus Daviesbacteria bacterium RIFCSPHIGHO2_02_FULL_39_41]OGE38920.1 MAG: hypothetical protein A3B42_04050 [Candidatus Daviesbacteria bacterium RIFCSPLOWO2_01_FULL_38_10]OGE45954.1 MAG: hypothetical protein A3E67_00300 [Candidatus Daviesbacteria bacterium RIFCSPHIGHO2_12_FULL_38_25]OGE68247.1 MAG: hypothetical protein A3H81_04290 [Candidatus Daviesbacteria bacterium RIFCSPLOWO2_02_FULL_38_18]OGE73537.1 MAG: hypothetical protein A3H18_05380 [Candida
MSIGEAYREPQVRGPQSQEQLDSLNRMIAKKERQGGVVKGYHGTSASLGREIMRGGFKDQRDAEGGFGIYFWDEEVANNARLYGQDKAKKLGESEYAVIEAELNDPRPDFLMGRPQWVVNGDNANILNIS